MMGLRTTPTNAHGHAVGEDVDDADGGGAFWDDEMEAGLDEDYGEESPADGQGQAQDGISGHEAVKNDFAECENEDDEFERMKGRLITNPNKAGTDTGPLTKEQIQRKVYEISKGSPFFKNEEAKNERMRQKIEENKKKVAQLTAEELARNQRTVAERRTNFDKVRDLRRTIVHIDMDAFYASVEELDRPELKTKPMAVGGKGVLSTANYVARQYGARSAMATYIARKLCPDLIVIKPNFEKYKAKAELIREIFAEYHPRFESGGMDEAYLDLTEYCESHEMTAEEVVSEIRQKIFEVTGLTASAGIACNRMLAKVCSDKNKPNGQFTLPSSKSEILEFMHTLPIRKVPGIGKVFEQHLNGFGVFQCGDLRDKLPGLLAVLSARQVDFLINVTLGIASNVVQAEVNLPKGRSRERSYAQHLTNPTEMYNELHKLAVQLARDLEKVGLCGRVISLKIKHKDFTINTRDKTLTQYIWTSDDIYTAVEGLLVAELEQHTSLTLRLIGVRLGGLHELRSAKISRGIAQYFRKQEDALEEPDTAQAAQNESSGVDQAAENQVDGDFAFEAVGSPKRKNDESQAVPPGPFAKRSRIGETAMSPHSRSKLQSGKFSNDDLLCTICRSRIPSTPGIAREHLRICEAKQAKARAATEPRKSLFETRPERSAHEVRRVACPICGKVFGSEVETQHHVERCANQSTTLTTAAAAAGTKAGRTTSEQAAPLSTDPVRPGGGGGANPPKQNTKRHVAVAPLFSQHKRGTGVRPGTLASVPRTDFGPSGTVKLTGGSRPDTQAAEGTGETSHRASESDADPDYQDILCPSCEQRRFRGTSRQVLSLFYHHLELCLHQNKAKREA
ncbi:hypothetical protein DFJ73DRAFT_658411 [Zopfochytrium polystomum]|nr:hypothetical protein DFJ73DRAFT_658411 [Zopfochytrium polystomum]